MSLIKALIADDELQSRNALAAMLQEFCPEVNVVKMTDNIADTVTFLNQTNVDVAFLDLSFGHSGTGFSILDQLKNYNCEVVFVTAYSEYALKAFNYQAINYLLKPVSSGDLIDTIERIKKRKNYTNTPPANTSSDTPETFNREQKIIALPNKNQTDFIPLDSIEYVEADGSYSIFHLVNGKEYTIAKNLKYFEENTGGISQFVRIHKSYIVNKMYVLSISKGEGGNVTLKSGTKLGITMSYREMLESLISG